MTPQYSEMQLDALAELANIASGTAATALSQMLGREVELRVPRALALPLADAVDAAGSPEDIVTGIVLGLEGDVEALVLLLVPADDAALLCQMLGVEAGTEVGDSALGEIGNILGTSYLNALSAMTGLTMMPTPPTLATDLLGAIVASVLAQAAGENDIALVLDSELDVADQPCSLSFLLLPASGRADELLAPLGLAGSGE
ncbi:MAG: chemotaxis protein CheC [Solirubrobacteraceae bacterium]